MTAQAAIALLGTATTSALKHLTDREKLILAFSASGTLRRTTRSQLIGGNRKYTFDDLGCVIAVCDDYAEERRQDRHLG